MFAIINKVVYHFSNSIHLLAQYMVQFVIVELQNVTVKLTWI